MHRDAGKDMPGASDIVADHRILQSQEAAVVIADKENAGDVSVDTVVLQELTIMHISNKLQSKVVHLSLIQGSKSAAQRFSVPFGDG